jgi:glucoamylase
LAAGRRDVALGLLRALEAFANQGGLLPEHVWDAPDIPDRELFLGQPSGSAMPLVWAHAEYIKLRRSLREGRVFDMPSQTVQRYQVDRVGSPYAIWRPNHKCRGMARGKTLRLEFTAPVLVHWSTDGWQSAHDAETRDTTVGMHIADLPTSELSSGMTITFTFYWPQAGRWENVDYGVVVE